MTHTRLLALFTSGLLFACSGGGSSGSSAAPSTEALTETQVFMGSTATDALFAFDAELDALHLVRADGTESRDLLSGSAELELVGLDGKAAWLGGAALEPGTYTSVRAVFDGPSVRARAADGTALDVLVESESWTEELDDVLVVDADSAPSLYLELDLEASLDDVTTSAPVTFRPDGDATFESGDMDLDEFRGVVLAASAGDRSLKVDAVTLNDRELGVIDVALADAVRLIDDDGRPFGSEAEFFAALVPELTEVEVEGRLVDGAFVAVRVELDGGDGGIGDDDIEVEIEGRVLHVDDGFFVLLIREIEKGAKIAKPVLSGLGGPSSIDVYFGEGSDFVLSDGTPASSTLLRPNQMVDVRFASFEAPPFRAAEVEFSGRAGLQVAGQIADITGLPESFVMRTSTFAIGDAPDRLVTVLLGQADIQLDVFRDPELDAGQLQKGLKVRVDGMPGVEVADRPSLVARKVLVRAGKLKRANVIAAMAESSSFETSGGFIVGTFGDGVGEGSLRVRIQDGARFRGSAGSEAKFFDLFDGLDPNAQLFVEVRGLGTGTPGEIQAYGLHSRVTGAPDFDTNSGSGL